MSDEVTNWKFYRVAYSRKIGEQGWCIFEQVNINGSNHLQYVDGPWATELEAKDEMRKLNLKQGLDFNGDES